MGVTLSTGVSTRSPAELTKLELWERGRALVGYGDWTPDHDKPYPMWAGMEAHKLFLVMRKRHISAEDFLLCCEYCRRHHKRIENAVWVFRFIAEAKQERAAEAAQHPSTDLGREIDEAIACERALSDDMSASWIGRLTRARGPYREEVLAAWRSERKQQ